MMNRTIAFILLLRLIYGIVSLSSCKWPQSRCIEEYAPFFDQEEYLSLAIELEL